MLAAWIYGGTWLIQTPTGHAILSVLSGLISEKNMSYFFVGTNKTCPFIQVSVEQGSTVVKFSAYVVTYL